MQAFHVECTVGAGTLKLETGKLAKQAHGAVVVTLGETMVLVAVVEGKADPNKGFFPLVVDYRERTAAAGKFPGGFIKREGRPTTRETLISRIIDRPIRPLFPAGYINEVQILCNVLSADRENDPDVLALIGSSACLHLCNIPVQSVTASARVGRVDGQFIAFPTYEQLEESDLDLIVSGTADAITMIEGFAREMPEDEMLEAIAIGHKEIIKIIGTIEKLREAAGLGEKVLPKIVDHTELVDELHKKFGKRYREAKLTAGKIERKHAIDDLNKEIVEQYTAGETPAHTASQVKNALYLLEERTVRTLLLEEKRLDGRGIKDVRPVWCEVGVLPRTHGSAIFQRGETQALVTAVLGTTGDEQRVDGLMEEYSKKFWLDYNFPPFSVGECKPVRGPGRREIGHGMLAERSLKAVLPEPDKFPYTIRLISDILESNGSSSMASVCGGTLALMDAGVPISDPVAGVSIGLVKEPKSFLLLTDIMGDEDHFADMDFKVAGTQRGICGVQLDMKIGGIDAEIIKATFAQAREARLGILRAMLKAIIRPRGDISAFAPRLLQIKIDPGKIGALIGPGGKNIKGIQEQTGAKIDINDDGTVSIAHSDLAGAEAARLRVEAITETVQVGKVYEGRVSSIKDFGAFIEIIPGRDGLCHISELADGYVGRVDEVCKVGDTMRVKVIGIDDQDRVKLSRKVLLREAAAAANGGVMPPAPPEAPRPPREPRPEGEQRREPRGDGDRGGRGAPRGRGGPRSGGGRPPREPRPEGGEGAPIAESGGMDD